MYVVKGLEGGRGLDEGAGQGRVARDGMGAHVCLVSLCVQLVQESSGTSFFFSETPVETPKDCVAEFVTAAAKAFAQGKGTQA